MQKWWAQCFRWDDRRSHTNEFSTLEVRTILKPAVMNPLNLGHYIRLPSKVLTLCHLAESSMSALRSWYDCKPVIAKHQRQCQAIAITWTWSNSRRWGTHTTVKAQHQCQCQDIAITWTWSNSRRWGTHTTVKAKHQWQCHASARNTVKHTHYIPEPNSV
jgi:hypothetical protein